MKPLQGELLSQCPNCLAVRVLTDESKKKIGIQNSIAVLTHIPAEVCLTCKRKNENT